MWSARTLHERLQGKLEIGKLRTSHHKEGYDGSTSNHKNTFNHKTYHINVSGNPNSCLIKFGRAKYRSLVDTGAEVSLIHLRVYQALINPPVMKKHFVNLQSVNGESLDVKGAIELYVELGGAKYIQKFYVVTNINRNVILGRDFLTTYGVRLYFDLGCLRIGKSYVSLEQDIHISSLVRLAKRTKLQPQSVTISTGKTKMSNMKVNNQLLRKTKVNNTEVNNQLLEISQIERGYLTSESGVMVGNTLTSNKNHNKLPIYLCNNTNRTITLRKGCVVGRADFVNSKDIASVNENSDKLKKLNLNELVCNQQFKGEIVDLLLKNEDIFAASDADLGKTDLVQMKVDTGDHPPIKLRPYRVPLNLRKEVDQNIENMLNANVIKRSKSPWSFPLVVVQKKDGTSRMCVDFRKLNKITKTMSYPLPLIDDILAQLDKSKYFTTLDLKSGYWQVAMDPSDQEKTAFACHKGLFEFNVMPFGLTNAPGVFQQLMATVLEGLEHFSTAYLDDIIIWSSSAEEHIRHIQQVFSRLRNHDLKLKLKKCSFFSTETNYLGFIINEHGIKPDPKKVEAIRTLPAPTTVKQVRSFIGMSSYYRRFIPNFSTIAEPLIALTRKYARFHWDEQCQKAFDFLKDSLTVVPLLAYPDPNKPYVLYTDASDNCVGACLTQPCDESNHIPNVVNEKPIYYLSHKLSDTQTRWSTIEKEAFAIKWALEKLDHYLHNAKFVIKTDHKPLKYILNSPLNNKKIQMWAMSIMGYNCTIEYITGRENTCADLLSRAPQNTGDTNTEIKYDIDDFGDNDNMYQVNALNSNRFEPSKFASTKVDDPDLPNPNVKDYTVRELDMVAEQAKDDTIQKLKTKLENGDASPAVYNRHFIVNDIVYYISNPTDNPTARLYVPKQLRLDVLAQYHDDLGHFGIDKTFANIKAKYYWPALYKEIYQYVERCVLCQTRNLTKQKAPTVLTDIPPYPWAKVGLDLSGPYPTTLSGNKYIISFICLYSGFVEAFPVKDKSADNICHLIINEIFPRYGAVLQLLTDNGTENINRKVQETLKALNISHVKTSFYHPQSNGKIERFHRVLHDVMSKKLQRDGHYAWDLYLNQTLAAIRFSISDATNQSPFFLLYNRDVVLPLDNILKPRRKYQGDDMHQISLEIQHESFMEVHRNLKKAKRTQAFYTDRKAKPVTFQIGDPVYYKNFNKKNKLDVRWRPYFRIIEKDIRCNIFN